MQILRVDVTPQKNGKVQIRLRARDDAGNFLDHWVSCPDVPSVATTMQEAITYLQSLASEVTEEEGFKPKVKK